MVRARSVKQFFLLGLSMLWAGSGRVLRGICSITAETLDSARIHRMWPLSTKRILVGPGSPGVPGSRIDLNGKLLDTFPDGVSRAHPPSGRVSVFGPILAYTQCGRTKILLPSRPRPPHADMPSVAWQLGGPGHGFLRDPGMTGTRHPAMPGTRG